MIRPSRERIQVERVRRERARQDEDHLNAAVYDALRRTVLRPETSLLEDVEDCADIVAAARVAASIVATHVEYTDRYPMAYRNAMRRIDA